MRKILIISSTFFPDPQVAAIRMTQWCRHLPAHGWKPHVLCRYYGHRCSEPELATAVHPDVTVEYLEGIPAADIGRKKWWTPVRKWLLRIIEYFGLNTLVVPDTSVFFWRRQRAHVLDRVRAIQPDVILTTSPPHAIHDLGMWLTAQTGIPWVADFRDPYLTEARFQPRRIGRLNWIAHLRFRDAIYGKAWLIVHQIPIHARRARRIFPEASARLLTLTNGFPLDLVEEPKNHPPGQARRQTVLVAGTIPEQEQAELARAVAQLAADGMDVQVKLVGKRPDSEPALRAILGERLLLTGYLSHAESIREIARADVLVNFLDDFRSQTRLLSTKLIEYLASGLPVVCVNPSRSDRLLLHRMGDVTILRRPRCEELESALRKALEGRAPRDTVSLERFRAEFNWPRRAAQLAPALDRLAAFPPDTVPRGERPAVPMATVVIVTRNRKDLLGGPVRSALHQSVPVEVLVIDDGSTDGTAELLRSEFPQVRLIRHENSRGYIVRRNEAATLASSPVLFSLDDDAVFSSAHVVGQTLADFDDSRVGAVAIPFADVRKSMMMQQGSSDGRSIMVEASFIGTAHALRREIFLKLGGYREQLVHQGEEMDYCLRMMAQGWIVRQGSADIIHHYESPLRDFARVDFYSRRNDVLFAWHNVPPRMLGIHLIGTTINGIIAGIKRRHLLRMMKGTFAGYAYCLGHRGARAPISASIYHLQRRLKKGGPLPLHEIEARLPAVARPREPVTPFASEATPGVQFHEHRGPARASPGPTMENEHWICCQLGAREHYAVAQTLHSRNALRCLITDSWTPPGPLQYYLPRSLRDRFSPELATAHVKAWPGATMAFELAARLFGWGGWKLMMRRNRWFQRRAIAALSRLPAAGDLSSADPGSATRMTVFAYSYAAREIFRYARSRGWRTVLGQIDPGFMEEKLVARLSAENSRQGSDLLAPAEYWNSWREECELADHIIVNSEWSRRVLLAEEIPQEKICVIPLAFEADDQAGKFKRAIPARFSAERPLRVLFLGQVTLRKGVGALLEAIRRLRGEPVEFWFVGPLLSDVPEDSLRGPQTRSFGVVSRGEVGEFYRTADVFVFPTLSDGFGLTQLEAQSWQLPVIASQYCGEVVQDGVNGLILPEVTAESITAAIKRILTEPGLLNRLAAGSKVADRFSLDALGEALLRLDA